MRIVGLDTSTRTGWVVLEHSMGSVIKLGHGELVADKKFKGLARLKELESLTTKMLKRYNPDIAIFEGYGYANAHTLATLVEIGTVIRLAAFNKGIPILDVPPPTLKKFVTGGGAAKKDKMMLEVYKRWGFSGTDNESDAYSLAQFGFALGGMHTKGIGVVHEWVAASDTVERVRLKDLIQNRIFQNGGK